ncbi:hypothetical protein Cde04nite_18110 [Cellulomonas denverensis]|nr:hypothetical protein Cde04nite_18110 [Cellulomonas denverensis]
MAAVYPQPNRAQTPTATTRRSAAPGRARVAIATAPPVSHQAVRTGNRTVHRLVSSTAAPPAPSAIQATVDPLPGDPAPASRLRP